jgi:hypothetical protein
MAQIKIADLNNIYILYREQMLCIENRFKTIWLNLATGFQVTSIRRK